MNFSAIIVAGGTGVRMGSEVPKQFIKLRGKPMLMHVIEVFARFGDLAEIILVLPHVHQEYWIKLCNEHDFKIPLKIVTGGSSRFHSVKNGLEMVSFNQGLVAVHDGSRPLVLPATIERVVAAAALTGAAIPVITPVESIRECSGSKSIARDRDNYRIVQTPQVFSISLLRSAYRQEYSPLFTDDASVVEAEGNEITLVDGNIENIKVTTPFDLVVAEALMKDWEK